MLSSQPDGLPVVGKDWSLTRRIAVGCGAILLLGALLFAVAGGNETSRVAGAGSTFADPMIQHASTAFQGYVAADRVDVARQEGKGTDWVADSYAIDYDPVGSIGGLVRLANPDMTFAATEVPVAPEDLAARNLAQFPILLGAVAPVVNLDLKGAALTLDAATLSAIFRGAVTRWSDPAIAALNPGVAIPDLPIAVRHRKDGSGTTLVFTGYLARDPAWTPGRSPAPAWPVGEGLDGTSRLLAAVTATPGAIGYAEVGQARRAGLTPVRLVNAAGNAAEPTPAAVRAAAAGLDWSSRAALTAALADSTGPDAWPMAATVHVVMRRSGTFAETDRALRFFRFFLAEAARSAESLGYVALPPEAAGAIEAHWAEAFGFGS